MTDTQEFMRRLEEAKGHTPGPWTVIGSEYDEGFAVAAGADQDEVALVSPDFNERIEIANARLIALAPEMADTIERLQGELRALREDAERLKFLCSRMFAVELSPDGHHKWIFRNKPLEGANVQAAIDAARSEGGEPI